LRALAVGCPKLTTLKLGGCKVLTAASLKALAKHSRALEDLLLGGCTLMHDKDFEQMWGGEGPEGEPYVIVLSCLVSQGVDMIAMFMFRLERTSTLYCCCHIPYLVVH